METGASDAVGPVVLSVRVEVPEALLTEDGLNLQVGGAVVAAAPFSVILPQESATLWLNPPTDVIVTVWSPILRRRPTLAKALAPKSRNLAALLPSRTKPSYAGCPKHCQ